MERRESEQRAWRVTNGHDIGEQSFESVWHTIQHVVQNREKGGDQIGGAFQRQSYYVVARRPRSRPRSDTFRPNVCAKGLHGIRNTHGDVVRSMQKGRNRAQQEQSYTMERGCYDRSSRSCQVKIIRVY